MLKKFAMTNHSTRTTNPYYVAVDSTRQKGMLFICHIFFHFFHHHNYWICIQIFEVFLG